MTLSTLLFQITPKKNNTHQSTLALRHQARMQHAQGQQGQHPQATNTQTQAGKAASAS
jgi:hypothetical protein